MPNAEKFDRFLVFSSPRQTNCVYAYNILAISVHLFLFSWYTVHPSIYLMKRVAISKVTNIDYNEVTLIYQNKTTSSKKRLAQAKKQKEMKKKIVRHVDHKNVFILMCSSESTYGTKKN